MPSAPKVHTGEPTARLVGNVLPFVPSAIVVDWTDNGRDPDEADSDEEIAAFADELLRDGQLQPVEVRAIADGKVKLVFGYRRLRAFLHIEKTNPAIRIRGQFVKINDEEALKHNFIENRSRKNPSPISNALVARRFMDQFQWDRKQVAELFGYSSTQQVDNLLSLLTLPSSIRARISGGSLPMAGALLLVGKSDAEAEATVADAERDVMASAAAAVTDRATTTDPGEFADRGDRASIPIDDSVPPAADMEADDDGMAADGRQNADLPPSRDSGEPEGRSDLPGGIGATTGDSDAISAGAESVADAKSLGRLGRKPSNKAPKTPKLGKNGQPIVGRRHVAEASRKRGGVAKRTWSDLNAVLTDQKDMVSETILNFVGGLVEEGELRRILNTAARDMTEAERRRDEAIAAGAPSKRLAGKGKPAAMATT